MKHAESSSSLYSISHDAFCNESFKIGDLVKKGEMNGRVAFVGPTEFEKGLWIGIILDRPEGKNNGTVKGKAYFKCSEKCGLFCRPNSLTKLGGDSAANYRGGKRYGSPTPSFAGSMAPSNAASQMGKEHSLYSTEYGYDLGQNVATVDGRVGKVKFLDQVNDGKVYVGILFSKPVGDSDGKFQGIKHFSSYPKYSTFLPADQVKLATTTSAALPPKTAPRETKASILRKEKRGDGGGTIVSSWRGSQESLNSQRSPRSPPPIKTGLKRHPNPMKDNEMIAGLKKDLQEKEAHLANLSKEMEERRSESQRLSVEMEILRNENRSLKLNAGEMTVKIEELEKELVKTQNEYEDRSFCCTEMEMKNEELEMKLSELRVKHLEPLIEVDEEQQNSGKDEGKIYLEMATQTEKHANSNVECQTNAEEQNNLKDQGKNCLEIATQTEKQGNSNVECQTNAEEKRSYSNAERQTAEEKGKTCLEMATQTEKRGNSNVECQTNAEEKKVQIEVNVQTDVAAPNNLADVGVQTEMMMATTVTADQNNIQIGTTVNRKQKEYSSSSTPPSNKNCGVLELNVMTLSMDADQHLPSGQNSPSTWQRKYDEKCKAVETLSQTSQFLNSIIADQEKKIEELKRLHAEWNGNGNSSSAAKKATPPPPPPKTRKAFQNRRRIYCEHCEQFDVHETEDCPKLEALAAEAMEHSAYSPKKREY